MEMDDVYIYIYIYLHLMNHLQIQFAFVSRPIEFFFVWGKNYERGNETFLCGSRAVVGLRSKHSQFNATRAMRAWINAF